MALNTEDASKIKYKAKIEWFKERFADITSGKEIKKETPSDFLGYTSSPDELISILGDLNKKASKLDGRIDFMSVALKIPIDVEKQPIVSKAVEGLDAESKGEYLSYNLYCKLLEQEEAARDNLDLSDIIENTTGDPIADSLLVQDRLVTGLASYNAIKPPSVPGENAPERYTNRYLNNVVSWNEHDYNVKQILSFADNYLGTFPDPSYIPWSLKRDAREEIKSTKNLGEFWENFSGYFRGKGKKVTDAVTGIVEEQNKIDKEFEDLPPLDPKKEPVGAIHDITKRGIEYTNSYLNGVDKIFEMNYGADLICCFVRWSGGLDIKTLKGLRALLQLFKTGLSLDFSDILASVKDIINNIFKGLLTHELIGMINQIYQRLVDPIKKWINNPDPRWQKIFTCTPIDELINNYIISAIDYVEGLLTNLIKNLYKQLEIKNLNFGLKLEVLPAQKKIGQLTKILDVVISALERSAICGTESSPTGEEIQKVMQAYGIGPDEPYIYTKEERPNIYNSFIPTSPSIEERETKLGGEFTAKFDTETKTSGIGKIVRIDECLKKVMPEDIVHITEWFEDIKAKSQEKV